MYGIVNDAIKTMVVENYGLETWEKICKEAGHSELSFSPMESYEDKLTGDIVGIISNMTGTPATEILIAFGKFWIPYARNSEYSSILEAFSESPVQLLESLDHLHTRLRVSMGSLNPPSFWVTHINKNEILLHYQSERDMPLEYFVQGLILGIFEMFNQKCDVEMIDSQGIEKCAFRIKF